MIGLAMAFVMSVKLTIPDGGRESAFEVVPLLREDARDVGRVILLYEAKQSQCRGAMENALGADLMHMITL